MILHILSCKLKTILINKPKIKQNVLADVILHIPVVLFDLSGKELNTHDLYSYDFMLYNVGDHCERASTVWFFLLVNYRHRTSMWRVEIMAPRPFSVVNLALPSSISFNVACIDQHLHDCKYYIHVSLF